MRACARTTVVKVLLLAGLSCLYAGREVSGAAEVTAPVSVKGIAIDEQGVPVAGVRVKWFALTQFLEKDPSPKRTGGSPVRQSSAEITTDSDGSFQLAFDTTGTAVIFTDHPPYARTLQKVAIPSSDLRIELGTKNSAGVQGRILNWLTKEPVAGAEVVLTLQETQDVWVNDRVGTLPYPLLGDRVRTVTDQSGHYSFDRMPPVKVQLDGWSDAVGPLIPATAFGKSHPVLTESTTSTIDDMFVFAGYTLSGRVVDAESSAPIAGAIVRPNNAAVNIAGKTVLPSTSDADGNYEVKGLRPMVFEVNTGQTPGVAPELMMVVKEGYNPTHYRKPIEGPFDPNELIIKHDFELEKSQMR